VNIDQRLQAIAEEIAELETEIGILDEQVAFQSEVFEDARIRALVAETPLADREAGEAESDLRRMERNRADAANRLTALRAEADGLLERKLQTGG